MREDEMNGERVQSIEQSMCDHCANGGVRHRHNSATSGAILSVRTISMCHREVLHIQQ